VGRGSATEAVSRYIDTRVAISEAVRHRLLAAGVPADRIRLIRNGVDLERFRLSPASREESPAPILFAAKLDPVKRPLLLADIAAALRQRRRRGGFSLHRGRRRPEKRALIARARRLARKHALKSSGTLLIPPRFLPIPTWFF
jgi:glycosyltransferase involved in cell wall biosynthesis